MTIKSRRKIIALGILVFFLIPIVLPGSQSRDGKITQDIFVTTEQKSTSAQSVTFTCSMFGNTRIDTQDAALSPDDATLIFERLKELNSAIRKNPYSQETKTLTIAFINLLYEKGLLSHKVPKETYLSSLSPSRIEQLQCIKKIPSSPQPYSNRGTSVLCSVGGEGSGLLLPMFLLPRPRFIMLWLGNGYSMATNMLTTRGYYAGGAQTGVTLGFLGIGLSYSLPGYSLYGFVGYALFAMTYAELMEHYPPNQAPVISDIQPVDGAEDVPVPESELQFRIKDADGDLMSYSVTTDPDIGSANGNLKPFGVYKVPLSGLQYNKIYRWTIEVTDGKETRTEKGSFFTSGKDPFDPFDQGWSYRKKITIDHTKVSDDLMDFPVLINITDQDLRDKAQEDGDDIIFMDQQGVATQLNHEIEFFNGGTGQLTAWVRLPTLSSAQDTSIYLYYGNASSDAQQFPEKVWSGHFQAVWHLNTPPLDMIFDSTAKDYDGIPKGGMTQSDLLDGKIGRCLVFDGVDDLISFTELTDTLNTGSCTAWVQTTSTDLGAVWGEGNKDNNKPYIILGKSSDDLLTYARDIYGLESNFQGRQSLGVNNGQWHQIVWLSKGSGMGNFFYFDGQQVSLNWQDGQNPNGIWFDDQSTDTHSIGGLDRPINDWQWEGRLDEIRLLDTPLSSAWIETEYANQNAPLDFFEFGPEEPHP